MTTDVYHLPACDVELVHSPLGRVSAAVNGAAMPVLRDALQRKDPMRGPPLGALAAALLEPCDAQACRKGPALPPFLGLILTRGCNMGCRYCDFGSGTGDHDMDERLVSQAIGGWARWVADAGGPGLDLHFFGGEPFVRPDLVGLAVHRLRFLGQKYGLPTRVEASTNGLLNGESLGFVQDYFDSVVLSLDGQAQDHDLHRPMRGGEASFERVWSAALALAESQVELCVRCCVSSANVARMPQIAEWLCRDLRPCSVTFEAMKPTPQSAAAGLQPPDPLLFARGLIGARRIARQTGVECVYAAISDQPRHTFCPVGQDAFIVAPDRSVRSCYLRKSDWSAAGLDMRIGRVGEDGRLSIDADAVRRLRQTVADRARCRRCFCRWSCAGGCVVTETPPGHALPYTDYCRQTRLVQACALLDDMGLGEKADRLLADEQAVAQLWENEDDRMGIGNESDAK